MSALTLLLIPPRAAGAGEVAGPEGSGVSGPGETTTGGALLACLAAGGVLGRLAAGRFGRLRRPALFASIVFLPEAACICLVPYLGGEPGAAAALFLVGAVNGLGNVVILTAIQKQVPPELLGRVMSAIMLSAFGSFPLSVAITGLLVHRLGPALYFPVGWPGRGGDPGRADAAGVQGLWGRRQADQVR